MTLYVRCRGFGVIEKWAQYSAHNSGQPRIAAWRHKPRSSRLYTVIYVAIDVFNLRFMCHVAPFVPTAEDLSEEALVFVKQVSSEAFALQPVQSKVYQTIASTIRAACDKEFGRGWNCVVGRSFGAFVTQKIKCYAYLSVFPGVSILLWKT